MLIALAALTTDRVIGSNNDLPRYLPDDLKRFKELTTWHTVLMGRKTYESLPEKVRPLPHRKTLLITRQNSDEFVHENTTVLHSIEEFLTWYQSHQEETIYNIWWGQIFDSLLQYSDYLYLTEIKKKYEGDIYFPVFNTYFHEISREKQSEYDFVTYQRNELSQ